MVTGEIIPETRHQSVRCITIHVFRNHQRHCKPFLGGEGVELWLRWDERAQAVSAGRVMSRYGK